MTKKFNKQQLSRVARHCPAEVVMWRETSSESIVVKSERSHDLIVHLLCELGDARHKLAQLECKS